MFYIPVSDTFNPGLSKLKAVLKLVEFNAVLMSLKLETKMVGYVLMPTCYSTEIRTPPIR